MRKFIYILTTFILLSACTRKAEIENIALKEASEQVWLDAHAAQAMLQEIDVRVLSAYEQCYYHLMEAQVMLKCRFRLPEEADMDALAKELIGYRDEASAGEAYYIQGAYLNYIGENTKAMQYLKKAEQYPTQAIIRGMTYYKMGRISESEQLNEIALENYQKALPALLAAGHPLYLASVYRELGRNTEDEKESEQHFEKALEAARFMRDTSLYMDIRYAQLTARKSYTPEVARICQYMCHKAGQKRYAYDLVKYYIRNQKADSARIYLDILATDTTAQIWSEEQYTLWNSQYLHLKGEEREAYETLYTLYNEYYRELEEKGRASAFVAAQHYDNELERARNLQLQVEKQRLYMTLAGVVFCVMCVAFITIMLLMRQRNARELEKAQAAQRIANLENELQIRREALKQVLQQRIALSKNLQEASLSHKKDAPIPQWAKAFVETNIFSTEEQWQEFVKEFEGCYGDLLKRLQTAYPRLTATDCQVIALYILGIDTADICLLMGLTQRTIWSRRMRIKEGVGLGEKESLDTWVAGIG